MKSSLQLKMGQQLAMTPQLQQAIKMLQLSSLELQQEIQYELDTNPLLELDEVSLLSQIKDYESKEQLPDFSKKVEEQPQKENAEWEEAIPFELSNDAKWSDIYSNMPLPQSTHSVNNDLQSIQSKTETLQDHLEWQLNVTSMCDQDRIIALTLIEAINPDGYLSCSLDEILQTINVTAQNYVIEDIKKIQSIIHQFDPVGCACINLKECLTTQLRYQYSTDPRQAIAITLIMHYLDALGRHDYAHIIKKMKITSEYLKRILALIHQLNPKPGTYIEEAAVEYIIPDVFVRKNKNNWHAELNPDSIPRLRINQTYATMLTKTKDAQDSKFIKNNLQEAHFFLKNLKNRHETLLKIVQVIVNKQQSFFSLGEEAMVPLVLSTIAEAVDMHESTISRVTTKKYIHTPRGIYELKYFFSSYVDTKTGGSCSSTAIRALIKKMVATENHSRPLSDNIISIKLEKEGINIARRTVAKYRESLNIPPSHERKHIK